VVALVVGQGARLTALGLALGLGGGWLLGSAVRSLLYGVSATDPAAFLAAPALFAVVALLASWLPARRASRAEPAEVLRS
jgi:putative ABC transport system permease protein